VIRFGVERSVRIQSRDGAWQAIPPSDLAQYVSEEHNPENAKGVNGVEVFVPRPILLFAFLNCCDRLIQRLVRRHSLPSERAEQLQRLAARLQSKITEAARDLGLQRAIEDPHSEGRSLFGAMEQVVQDIAHLGEQDDASQDLRYYLQSLARELAFQIGVLSARARSSRRRGAGRQGL
jgi:hypothetical protein